MSNSSNKEASQQSADNTLRYAFNDADKSLTTSTFVTAKVGHKIMRNVISPTVDDFESYDGSSLLFTIRVTYTNSTHDDIVSVERTV